MATNFPGSLDNSTSLPYPTALNGRNAPSLAQGQDNQNDAVIATETKLGTGASTPTLNNLLIGTGAGTSAWSKAAPSGTIVGTTDSQTLTNKILTSPTISSPIITNATISADTITGFTSSNTGTIYGIAIASGQISGANTINGSALVAGSVGSTALATNAVQGNQLATSAITLGYAQITSSFTTSSATYVQVTGLSVTVTIPAGSRRIKITVWSSYIDNATSSFNNMTLWDGPVNTGTQIGYLSVDINATNTRQIPSTIIASVTPSAGSKTYNVGLFTTAGTANLYAATTSPAFILVEAI